MTLHTHHEDRIRNRTKRVISHRDENNKRWIIEMTLRDPEEELKNKKEEEYNAKQIKNNR
jgi:glycine cleavage system H lipoate-binding protein